jgi:hypothetical protein
MRFPFMGQIEFRFDNMRAVFTLCWVETPLDLRPKWRFLGQKQAKKG